MHPVMMAADLLCTLGGFEAFQFAEARAHEGRARARRYWSRVADEIAAAWIDKTNTFHTEQNSQ